MQTAVETYIASLKKNLRIANATEHTHRPALKIFIESLKTGITATNEPRRVSCGAPDFIVAKGYVPLGYIETKWLGDSLDKVEGTEQLLRYRESLANLVLTNYIEFRWYVAGELRLTATLGTLEKRNTLKTNSHGAQDVLKLLNHFLETVAPIVSSPKELAIRMASLARLIRDVIQTALATEPESLSLHNQLKGFREVLIHDLSNEKFADMYAQTICYGLFAARCNAPEAEHFTREHAAFELPKTNPFLRRMFGYIAGPELDERIVWAVDDLAHVLDRTNINAILKDFGKHLRQDPVLHFYETFLAAYDPEMREARGVYYTPEPIVSFIVRSVDLLLQQEFMLKSGLADSSKIPLPTKSETTDPSFEGAEVHRVLVLDPAVGTGTFLYSVIELVRARMADNQGMWSSYVTEHLLPRLYGFEYLMAPYAVAHLKLGLLLDQTGYDFRADERLGIYLTNTLEEAHAVGAAPPFTQWLAEEANAASRVKEEVPVMVVIGNPPYSGHSENKGDWITGLVESYKKINGKKLRLGQGKWLQNDYVKFIRFAQHRIQQTGYGILAMITDHSYVDSGTFVGMRADLLKTFDDLYVLDLQGNAKRNRNRDDCDENVFDITQGVAILVAVKRTQNEATKENIGVHTAQIRGSREQKYEFLYAHNVKDVEWELSACRAPYYLFSSANSSFVAEYSNLPSIIDIFPGSYSGGQAKRIGTGFVSTHDSFAIAYSAEQITDNVETFLNTKNEDEARGIFSLCGQDQWNYEDAKKELPSQSWKAAIREVTYRPFDVRFTVWNKHVCVHRRLAVHDHLVGDNLALCVGQAGNVVGDEEWTLAFVTDKPVDFNVFYRGGCAVLPLYLYEFEDESDLFGSTGVKVAAASRKANVGMDIVQGWAKRMGCEFESTSSTGAAGSLTALDVAEYVYAIVYSPTYRERYAAFLDVDYPRIPLCSDIQLFRALAELGAELMSLHLERADLDLLVTFPKAGNGIVETVRFESPTDQHAGKLWINDTQYFDGVSQETWKFHVGGYQPCEKWLKDRRGMKLSYEDIAHYQYIVAVIDHTRKVMQLIDDAVSQHSGWPIPV